MTEDEARTKWCPFARVAMDYHEGPNRFIVGFNRDMLGPESYDPDDQNFSYEPTRCIGSACMAWRWLPLMADEAFKNAIIKAVVDIDDKSENKTRATRHVMTHRAEYGLPEKPFAGYCGLAGKPE